MGTSRNSTRLSATDLRRARGGKCNRCNRYAACNAVIRAAGEALCNSAMGFAQYKEQQTGHRGYAKVILAWWKERGPQPAATIADKTGINYNTVAGTLQRLRKNGELEQLGGQPAPALAGLPAEEIDTASSASGESWSGPVGILRDMAL